MPLLQLNLNKQISKESRDDLGYVSEIEKVAQQDILSDNSLFSQTTKNHHIKPPPNEEFSTKLKSRFCRRSKTVEDIETL